MKKEEFPTFLNEQPKVVFGRTARELLIFACGMAGGFSVWNSITDIVPDPLGSILGIGLAIVVIILSIILAVLPIANRPLEEWATIWVLYQAMPKVYLFKPLDDLADGFVNIQDQNKQMQKASTHEED